MLPLEKQIGLVSFLVAACVHNVNCSVYILVLLTYWLQKLIIKDIIFKF